MSSDLEKSDSTEREMISRGQRLWIRLLEARKTAPVSQWRAKLLTASWKETEGLPVPIRRARAFEKIMSEIPIFIDDEQLLAGNYGSWPMAAEWRPEITVEWILERFETGRGRMIIRDEDIPVMKEIAGYWKDRAIFSCYHRYIGEAEEKRLKDRDFLGAYLGHTYHPALWALGWCIPDYPKAIRKGLLGIKAEIEEEIKETPMVDDESSNKRIFLEALGIVIDAGIHYARRHAVLAREMAKNTAGKRKSELERMADICEWVPANPARTFHEALQTMWLCNLFIFFDCKYEGISPGRVDQYLYPYYRRDVEEGRLTLEDALDLLELLRCHFSSYRLFLESSHTARTTGEANWFNCVLGGQTPDGRDATNELSYLWLEAAKRLGTPHPTLSVRVHQNMDENFALNAADLCAMGRGYPAFFGDRSNINFLLNQGIPMNEARDYAIAGCTLTHIAGRMSPARVFGANMPKLLELALHNGVDPRTGMQLGPRTGSFEDLTTYEDLYEAYHKQVASYLGQGAADFKRASLFQVNVLPHLFPSVLADDCIKRGKPHNGGGCHYQQGMWYLLPQGPIDVADSLAAIKKCVYEDRIVTKKQLLDALAADFEGEEHGKVHHILLSAAKYGNDDDYVDLIARDVYTMLDTILSQIDGCYGTRYVQAPHSLTGHGAFGKAVGALPSGRRAGLALADGNASPCQGMDRRGITAVLKSAAKLDQAPMQGCLLNQKLHPSALRTKNDLNKFLALIKTYLNDYEGKHIQFNIVDRDTLLDAQGHPDNYGSLVIRVAGYSALWVELDSIIQDEIIARTEQII